MKKLLLSETKILNGKFTLVNQGAYVGVALAEDTSYVNEVLSSEIAKGIFSEDNFDYYGEEMTMI